MQLSDRRNCSRTTMTVVASSTTASQMLIDVVPTMPSCAHICHSLSTILKTPKEEPDQMRKLETAINWNATIFLTTKSNLTTAALPFIAYQRGMTATCLPFGWVAAHSSQDQTHHSVSRSAASADTSVR